MKDHHRKAIEQAQTRLIEQNPSLLAILVGGSIAKGTEREDSDVEMSWFNRVHAVSEW